MNHYFIYFLEKDSHESHYTNNACWAQLELTDA